MSATIVRGWAAPLVAVAALLLAGCTASADVACGWDTSSPEGQAALQAHLVEVDAWLTAHPGTTPPASTSPFWHGDCPVDTTNIGPPVGEDENPH